MVALIGFIHTEYEKRLSSKAEASEESRHTLRYVELQSDVRTQLAVFFRILLAGHGTFRC